MKFWQKIFLGTLVIFMLAFDAGATVLTNHAYSFNRQRENESGIREQSVILSSVESRISSAEKIYPDAPQNAQRLAAVLQPLADYYQPQGVLLALYHEESEVYTNIPGLDNRLLTLEDAQSKNITDRVSGGKRQLFVASRLPGYPHLTLVYARDISRIDDFRKDVSRVFIAVNAVVLVVMGGSVYLLLRRLTRPITQLNKMTAEIAGGAYDQRVTVNRSDELGRLGHSFNRMADSVEENMARLTKAAEDRQQFIDDLIHEMKTPLTSILGYAEYLQNAKSTEKERMTAAGHLYGAALRLKNLSVKLLELAALRGEKVELRPVDIPALFGALTEIMRPVLAARKLELVTLPEILLISGDETLLLSLLTNLAENAAKASVPGGLITVKAYREKAPVITVSDRGHGMEGREIEKITAPFYCVDKSRSRKFGGVGLGLSIVSQIADLHGAKLEIESAPGEGTTVKIRFDQ